MRFIAQSLLSAQVWFCDDALPPLELLHAGDARATTAARAQKNDTARRPWPAGVAKSPLNVITTSLLLAKSIPSKSRRRASDWPAAALRSLARGLRRRGAVVVEGPGVIDVTRVVPGVRAELEHVGHGQLALGVLDGQVVVRAAGVLAPAVYGAVRRLESARGPIAVRARLHRC